MYYICTIIIKQLCDFNGIIARITPLTDPVGINYGFDRVRFPSPVAVGARIRAVSTLKRAEIKGGMIETMNEIKVEVQGQDKPAVVAESLGRLVL